MIVDDEEEILKGLKNIITAMDLGFEKISTQSDPIEAEKIICENGYDIVISDICMDQRSGLDMIRAVKEKSPDCKFVIISGYDDFVYMKDAIRLGVSEYICKPVDKTELKEILIKLKQTVELKKQEKMREYLRSVVMHGKQSLLPPDGWAESLRDCYITVIKPLGKAQMNLPQSVCAIESDEYTILLSQNCLSQDQLQHFLSGGFFACSSLNMRSEELHLARDQIKRMSLYRPFFENEGIAFYDNAEKLNANDANLRNYLTCFENELSKIKKNTAYIHSLLETIFSSKMKSFHYLLILKAKDCVETAIAQNCGADFLSLDYEGVVSTSDLICDYEEKMNFEVQAKDIGIDRALEYIDAHFTENITLASVSNRVNFNYSYFSRMFKKQMGVTFIQYITQKRMELAVKLLADPDIKVYEIAHRIGYEESKHFTKTFKNYFGLSPDQFRCKNPDKSSN